MVSAAAHQAQTTHGCELTDELENLQEGGREGGREGRREEGRVEGLADASWGQLSNTIYHNKRYAGRWTVIGGLS